MKVALCFFFFGLGMLTATILIKAVYRHRAPAIQHIHGMDYLITPHGIRNLTLDSLTYRVDSVRILNELCKTRAFQDFVIREMAE
jgi:hypothetical protein